MELTVIDTLMIFQVEVGDTISIQGDEVEVTKVTEEGDRVIIVGISSTTGDLEEYPFFDYDYVDLLGVAE